MAGRIDRNIHQQCRQLIFITRRRQHVGITPAQQLFLNSKDRPAILEALITKSKEIAFNNPLSQNTSAANSHRKHRSYQTKKRCAA